MTVTILSAIVLIIEIIFVVIFFLTAKKHKTVVSKNTVFWFIPVFLFLFSLYTIGYIASTNSIGIVGIISGLSAALKSFAFEINMTNLQTLLNNNIIFSIAFYVAYLLGVFTVIGTAISLGKDYVLNMFRVKRNLKKTSDIVVGYNDASLMYINENPKNKILWITEPLTTDQTKYLYENKISFIKGNLTSNNVIKKGFKKQLRYNFIMFESVETQYQQIINEFIQINKKDYLIFLYLEVKYQEMEVVRKAYISNKEDNPNLYIRAFSRYEMISRKFVSEVTIPSLLPNDFFNKNRTLKSSKEVNVIFYGFGRINASLFTMFSQNNQLVGMSRNQLKSKPINYYLFDKDKDAFNDKRIEYIVNNVEKLKSDFPLPDPICNLHKFDYNINSIEAINKIKEVTSKSDTYNLVIVSYGSDYENAETAMWLHSELNNDNIKIACRLKNNRLKHKDIIYFGNEQEIINHNLIVNEELQELAKGINRQYNKFPDITSLEAEKTWDKLEQIKLYSNYYSAMNIRFKLNLLGFDLTKDSSAKSISKDEFREIYGESLDNNDYDQYFETSTRNVIAYSEKLRWNAFYLFNGYKPMPKDKIKFKDNKIYREDLDLKLHACLTSYKGLDDLHQYLLSHKDNQGRFSLNDIDFYKYDYMTFDNKEDSLIDTLFRLGYKIIKLAK